MISANSMCDEEILRLSQLATRVSIQSTTTTTAATNQNHTDNDGHTCSRVRLEMIKWFCFHLSPAPWIQRYDIIYTRPMWSIRHASDNNHRIVQSKVSHTIIRHTEKLRNSVKEEKERARERAEIRVTQCTQSISSYTHARSRTATLCVRMTEWHTYVANSIAPSHTQFHG